MKISDKVLISLSALLFDSRDARCKTPFGAVPTDDVVSFRLFLPMIHQLRSPVLLMFKADRWDSPERVPMRYEGCDGVSAAYTCIFYSPDPQLYFYRFEVEGVNGTMQIARDNEGFGKLLPRDGEMWQLTVYNKAMRAPKFLQEGILYQIMPDRFCRSSQEHPNVPQDRRMHNDWYELPEYLPDQNGETTNSDYFGGDLKGITEQLPYLKSLGVASIYLNPIFEAHSNHRYNTADYLKIDPLLGDEEDLRTLCAEGKKVGIHIILDGVFNHTGADSVYFNKKHRYGNGGAFNDPQSPYRNWYDFTNYPNEYHSWWGFLELPNLNENEPSLRKFFCGEDGVLDKWMKAGVSGWRLDVADELPNLFLDELCARVKETNPESLVIGEVWEDASTKIAYGVRRRYLLGGQLDSVMNYPFKDAILSWVRDGDCNRFYTTVMNILEHYPKPVLDVLMNSLSTHDVERAITALGGQPVAGNSREWQGQNNMLSPHRYALGKQLFQLAAVLQYMLPGVPCLYYGDEAGLYGYKDPFNRTCYPWGREDPELLTFFRALGAIRTGCPGLASGDFCAVSFTPECVSFVRDCGEESYYIAVNRGEESAYLTIPGEFRDAVACYGELLSQDMLAARSAVILELK